MCSSAEVHQIVVVFQISFVVRFADVRSKRDIAETTTIKFSRFRVEEAEDRKIIIEVLADRLQALLAVRSDESLLGAKHKTEADDIWRAYNGWLTKNGVTGTLKSYLVRHKRLQQYRDELGVEGAAAGGGHRTTKMVERKYTRGKKVMPMMAPLKAAS